MTKTFLSDLLLSALLIAFVPQYASAQNAATATSLSVSTLTTGTILDVTPSISSDGRYVNLNMNVSSSSLEGIDTFAIPSLRLDQAAAFPAAAPSGQPSLSPIPQLFPNQNASAGPLLLMAPPPPGVTFIEKDKKPLQALVPALSSDALTLPGAIKRIAALSRQNIVLGIAALKKNQIDLTTPLKLQLPEASLKSTLSALLTTAAPDAALVVTSDDNVIYITTRAQADNAIETKTYYAEDLAANASKWLPKQMDPATHELKPIPIGDPSGMMSMIAANLRPEIWKSNGGKIASMYQVQNRITITAPASVHALLDGPKVYNPNAAPLYINYAVH